MILKKNINKKTKGTPHLGTEMRYPLVNLISNKRKAGVSPHQDTSNRHHLDFHSVSPFEGFLLTSLSSIYS